MEKAEIPYQILKSFALYSDKTRECILCTVSNPDPLKIMI